MKAHVHIPVIAWAILFLLGCGTGADEESNGSSGEKERFYGDTLHVPQTEDFQTLYPYAVTDLVSFHVASQIHEGLFKFDPQEMTVEKALLEKHKVSEDGKVHEFTLKDDIFFHPDPCFESKEERRIRAEDVEYSFELLCSPSPHNENFKMTFKDRVKGAKAYYEGEADGISGFEALDEKSFKLELKQPSSSFLYTLSSPAASIVSKKAVEEYGHEMKVGAGPFRFSELKKDGEELVLDRFEEYHMKDSLGNRLPYLDRIHFHFINSKMEQLTRFKENELHMIHGLPSEKVKEVVEEDIEEFTDDPPRYILKRSPEMATQFYEFNLSKEVFANKDVRKAFSYAVDRERIVEEVLNGEAYGPGTHGITPPTFKGYDIEEIEGYSHDPEKAREHLKKAGYPNGKDFPHIKIELNKGGGKNISVAEEIRKQLKATLNIDVDFEVVSFSKKLENAKMAKGDIWRSAWVADYPSPENFLWLGYGEQVPGSLDEPSWPNVTRYQNPSFDSLYVKGRTSLDEDSSYRYFKKAEQLLMDDAPMLILWYGEQYRLIHADVRNFHSNPMKYFDFRKVHLKQRKKDEGKAS